MNKIFLALLFLSACAHHKKSDTLFHYSVLDAMRNGVYAGDIPVKELRTKGDFGLGTFNHLDGEMVVLDGEFYRIKPDGSVIVAEDEKMSPFLNLTHFTPDTEIDLGPVSSFEELNAKVLTVLPTKNQFMALRIRTRLSQIDVGGASEIPHDDTQPLAKHMKTRPVYRSKDVRGTLVGFYFPEYAGGIDLVPFHWHFLSDEKKFGGHILSAKFSSDPVRIEVDLKSAVHVQFPEDNSHYRRDWAKPKGSKSTY